VHPVDIGAGDQFKPEFLAISPNNKIPAIVDPDGPDGQPISLFESGAILLYLAGKTGRFLPADVRGKYEVLQWLMFQMGGVGPMLGQAHHFRIYAPEKIPYAVERYTNEARRLYGVMNRRWRKLHLHRRAPSTASPTSPSSPGCARGRTRASTGTTIRT
jgi:GSH-dependent disulfide-bond oxidoreductase